MRSTRLSHTQRQQETTPSRESGWPDLNRRPRAPQARALVQAELHPDEAPQEGLEPPASRLTAACSAIEILWTGTASWTSERVTGFEPVFPAWEAGVLPLDDTRVDTPGGTRTLTVRLRGGCSTRELRRHRAAPRVGRRRFTTAIRLSESYRQRATVSERPKTDTSGDAGSRTQRANGSGSTGRRVSVTLYIPRRSRLKMREAGDPFGNPASVAPPRSWRRSIRRASGGGGARSAPTRSPAYRGSVRRRLQ